MPGKGERSLVTLYIYNFENSKPLNGIKKEERKIYIMMNDVRKVFIDDYEHLDDDIEYIVENVLQDYDDDSAEYKILEYDFQSIISKKCKCINSTCDGDECFHGGNYELKNGKLLLRNDRKCMDLIYECDRDCCINNMCFNKLVCYGPISNLKIQKFPDKGYGIITKKIIHKGSFICEYAGEILTKQEANRRDQFNQLNKQMNYILCLNEYSETEERKVIQTFIDPSKKGNIARYINHSCNPNCEIISVRVDSIIPKIAIFAKCDINVFEELTFSYGNVDENLKGRLKLCHCKSDNCKTYLPNILLE